MSVYLYSDTFLQFRRFFNVETQKETKFLYDIAFGFMPRYFSSQDIDDKVIYDEEEEVLEMYFVTEGVIGVAFSLITNGFTNKQY